RALHPSRGHLQSSTGFLRRRSSHIPLEELCSWQQETQNDPLCRGVHPAILLARSAEGVRPDSTFWIHGQFSASRFTGTLPPTAGYGTHRSFYGNDLDQFGSLVSDVSWANHCRREIESGSASMEIRFQMLLRYVVAMIQNLKPHDVPLHVRGNVCPCLQLPSIMSPLLLRLMPEIRHSLTSPPIPAQ